MNAQHEQIVAHVEITAPLLAAISVQHLPPFVESRLLNLPQTQGFNKRHEKTQRPALRLDVGFLFFLTGGLSPNSL